MPSETLLNRTLVSTSARKWCIALIACCSVLATACSDSDSGSSTAQPADDRLSELTPANDNVDDDDASDDTAENDPVDGDDVPAGDPATDDASNAAVCDLVAPMAEAVVEAFSFGFMTSDGHRGRGSRCEFAVAGEPPGAGYELETYVAVERMPAVIADVTTAAESFDVGGSSTPAPSVSDDAVLVTDGAGDMAVVVFSAGGRVWSVQGHSPWVGIETPPGNSVDEATVEVARIVRSGLG